MGGSPWAAGRTEQALSRRSRPLKVRGALPVGHPGIATDSTESSRHTNPYEIVAGGGAPPPPPGPGAPPPPPRVWGAGAPPT
ncbi:hypothetical protein AAHZ94_10675, partial [Streptomyces sp. HSW2009]|uniref:hypothetical protein n=1 Tax=Streptomyces sp. HSW2009 TaxID=3142890 RepID=UPI0032EBF35A